MAVVKAFNIVFTNPPGPEGDPVFIEVETDSGQSIRVGEWGKRPDGFWALRLTENDFKGLE